MREGTSCDMGARKEKVVNTRRERRSESESLEEEKVLRAATLEETAGLASAVSMEEKEESVWITKPHTARGVQSCGGGRGCSVVRGVHGITTQRGDFVPSRRR